MRSGAIVAAIVGSLLGAAAPARAQSAPDEPPVLEPHVVHQQRAGFLTAGGVTFGVSYGAALLAGFFVTGARNEDNCGLCASDHPVESKPPLILVPVAGPLLAWWQAPESSRGSPVVWVAWSGLQAAGAAMLIAGMVGHDVVEWRPAPEGPRVRVLPAITPELGALSLDVSW